ncbi:PIG-L deacetylase family protein [Nocardioides sp. YIM 152588]|uniref:PIG-L deacetylase family protein n=1 Tax=Nocardioides sp. YIM 152588 TaxID=3158259 RepID=UPI0032E4EFEC
MKGLVLPAGAHHVLCLGAHPDDIEIGCGATLLTLAGRPDTRFTAMVLTGDGERQQESTQALQQFAPGTESHFAGLRDGRLPVLWEEVKDALEALGRECRPDLVLAPRPDDAHQDHRLVGQLASTVWRDAPILHYEIPKWDGDLGSPQQYVPVSEGIARRKVELLNKYFPSQADRDWWDDEMFLGLMRLRGMECRSRYAEAYYCSKMVLRLAQDRG